METASPVNLAGAPAGRLSSLRWQVGLIAVMQGLLLTNNATLISVNALAGFQLSDDKLLATLPVTGYVVGGAVWAMPAAMFMRRFGRRAGYSAASFAAAGGAVLGWHALVSHSLWMLCLATFICGLYSAFGASLRFAAADAADAYRPSFKARAISLALFGGIAGGIVGPEVSKWSRSLLPAQFAGTYLTLIGFAMLSLLLAQGLRLPRPVTGAAAGPVRPLSEILRQPACRIAILTAALAYGVMNLLMVATPLAMQVCGHDYNASALVIEWHVVGMFAPGLVTGSLIARFGVLPVIAAGCLLMIGCVGVALSGLQVAYFVAALVLLGVGWNFMFTGATALLTGCYRPQEKNKVQGFTDVCVFGTMITSSASAGVLMHVNGWALLNLLSLPFMLAVLVGVGWLAMRPVGQRSAA